LKYLAKIRAAYVECFAVLSRLFNSSRTRLKLGAKRIGRSTRHGYGRCYRRAVLMRYSLLHWRVRHGRIVAPVILILLIATTLLIIPVLQPGLESYFTGERLAILRNLLATIGGALVGATAIGFSVVMIAVQLNFARIPHGLFRKLSADIRLLGAFAVTFILAAVVAALSLIPDASWATAAITAAVWGNALILLLFLYGYRRTLDLVNPLEQLRLVVAEAEKDMRVRVRRANRVAPLLDHAEDAQPPDPLRSNHDMPRMVFFQANPSWTVVSRQAVTHAVSFARRYAEQGDYEVANNALLAVAVINTGYVEAKGKTFFARHLLFENPQATDAFINDTLDHLRQLAQVATTRGDEAQIRQIFAAMANLVQVYMRIDYANQYVTTKHHAHLAASYLMGAIEAVLPHNMPDVLMEGVRKMGQLAQLFLSVGNPNDIVTLTEKIALISCAGVMNQNSRPVTLVGMEQLAELTFNLIRGKTPDIRFTVEKVRANVALIVRMFLNVPDMPLASTHSSYLAPYYSLTTTQTLGAWLTDLANALTKVEADNQDASMVIRNIEQWAENLYRTEKEVLLIAIEKRSHFTFDVIHWIAHVTKLLVFLSRAPAANDRVKQELQRHALWLIGVLSWIPDDKDTTAFVETFGVTDLLFEVALDTMVQGDDEVSKAAGDILFSWAFKAGHHAVGWSILDRSLSALATLALWQDDPAPAERLKAELAKRLNAENTPEQEMRDDAARELRRHAETLYRPKFELSRIHQAMHQIDQAKMRPLLQEIADLLSPGTVGESIDLLWP
jgi:hypothetical protein